MNGAASWLAALMRRKLELPEKSKMGFHTMARDEARALSRRGTRTVVELANDYGIPAQRGGNEKFRP